jgi:hypothetical protein
MPKFVEVRQRLGLVIAFSATASSTGCALPAVCSFCSASSKYRLQADSPGQFTYGAATGDGMREADVQPQNRTKKVAFHMGRS